MKVLPIQIRRNTNQTAFKGQEYYFSHNPYNGNHLTTDKSRGVNHGNGNFVTSGHPNPYATVEKVNHARVGYGAGLGLYPPIYWTDPMENLSDAKKGCYDFIVFDNEPPFPDLEKDIEKRFFGEFDKSKKDYIQEFLIIKNYFARLEKADIEKLKELQENKDNLSANKKAEMVAFYHNRVNDSKRKQYLAEECRRIYMEADAILRTKTVFDYSLSQLKIHTIEEVEEQIRGFEDFINNLEENVAPIKNQIRFFQNKIGCYKTVLKLNTANTPMFCADENLFILDKLKDLKDSLKYRKQELKEKYKKANELRHKIAALQTYIKEYPQKLQEVQDSRRIIMAELAPIFERLKAFYIQQGIKIKP